MNLFSGQLRSIRKNEIDSEFGGKSRRNRRTRFDESEGCLRWIKIGANFIPSFNEGGISDGGSYIGGEAASGDGA
jgi:hypothetical protein